MYEVGNVVMVGLKGSQGAGLAFGTGLVADIAKVEEAGNETFYNYLLDDVSVEPHGEHRLKDSGRIVVRETEILQRLWAPENSLDDGDGFYVCLVTDYDVLDIAAKFDTGDLELALRLGLLEAMNLSVGRSRALGEEINIAQVTDGKVRWMIG